MAGAAHAAIPLWFQILYPLWQFIRFAKLFKLGYGIPYHLILYLRGKVSFLPFEKVSCCLVVQGKKFPHVVRQSVRNKLEISEGLVTANLSRGDLGQFGGFNYILPLSKLHLLGDLSFHAPHVLALTADYVAEGFCIVDFYDQKGLLEKALNLNTHLVREVRRVLLYPSADSTLNVNFIRILRVRTSIDVFYNQFSGDIPPDLGRLLALRYLTLSHNNFSGSIPPDLSSLHELESLDMSENSLSGGIPVELEDIPQLAFFNVSNNLLAGPIPDRGQFLTFKESSFEDNSGLCGFPLAPCGSSPSPAESPAHSSRQKLGEWISLLAFFVGFGGSYEITFVMFIVNRRARSLLYFPREKSSRIDDYNKPYGAYQPPA